MIIRDKGTPGGLAGAYQGEAKAFSCGRAEPAPPRRGRAQRGSPCGEDPEITRKAFFSEGRTPCVRVAGPDASRGMT